MNNESESFLVLLSPSMFNSSNLSPENPFSYLLTSFSVSFRVFFFSPPQLLVAPFSDADFLLLFSLSYIIRRGHGDVGF